MNTLGFLGRVGVVAAAALLAPLGSPPTVILGPGEPQLAHQTDEYCKVSRIHESVDIFAGLIRDWCQD